jgi:hypothetical protein
MPICSSRKLRNFAIKKNITYLCFSIKKIMEKPNVKDEILLYLEQEERPLAWLSRKTEIPYPTLYSIFIQRIMNLSDTNLGNDEQSNKPNGNALQLTAAALP